MARKVVTPDPSGRYTIEGKDGRNLVFEFVNSIDKDNHIIEELVGDDLEDKLPSPRPTWKGQRINWFVNFSVYNKKGNEKNGYASVPYFVSVNLEEGKSLLFYIDGQVQDKTEELRRNNRVRLSAGDPPGGYVP